MMTSLVLILLLLLPLALLLGACIGCAYGLVDNGWHGKHSGDWEARHEHRSL